MDPFDLVSARLVLDQPTAADIDTIHRICQDPVFERVMSTPWPYRRAHAESFVNDFVPTGWRRGREFTWALRHEAGGPLLGVLGVRTARSDIGYWLDPLARGNGYMPEAVSSVADHLFGVGWNALAWECVVGNTSSAAVARKCGFTFAGEAPATIPSRDGSTPAAWHGVLRAYDDRSEKPGWPA